MLAITDMNLTFKEENQKNEISEYCYQKAKSLWIHVKDLILNHKSTPFLIYYQKESSINFEILCEEDSSSNYSIFDSDKIIIYPTRFQEWLFKNQDENYVISEISKHLEITLTN